MNHQIDLEAEPTDNLLWETAKWSLILGALAILLVNGIRLRLLGRHPEELWEI